MLKECDVTDIKDGKIEIIITAKVDQDSFDEANKRIRALQEFYLIPYVIIAISLITGSILGAIFVSYL